MQLNWSLLLGFLGGIAAVALKGAVDFYFARRLERRTVRAAARLVGHEYDYFALWLDMVSEGEWIPPGEWAFDVELWRESKMTLAAALNRNHWREVVSARRWVAQAEGLFEERISDRLDTGELQLVRMYRDDIRVAADFLQHVSEGRFPLRSTFFDPRERS